MKIDLKICIPEPSREADKSPYTRKLTPCEKAQLLIDRIEDPMLDSQTEWEVIKETYRRLQKLNKLSSEMKRLMAIVEETVSKYASMDSVDGDILQADSYRKWMRDDDDDEDYGMETHLPPIYARGRERKGDDS